MVMLCHVTSPWKFQYQNSDILSWCQTCGRWRTSCIRISPVDSFKDDPVDQFLSGRVEHLTLHKERVQFLSDVLLPECW